VNRFWEFKAQAEGEGALYIYSEISDTTWYGDEVTPKEFQKELDALGSIHTLHIYINSPGGDVFAGHAIYTMIKRCTAKTIAHIDGVAASIASVIPMAADKVIMPENAMMMIHLPGAGGFGNSIEHRKIADTLDKVTESMIAAYLGKAKSLTREKLASILEEETWLTASECLEYGFADEVEQGAKAVARLNAEYAKRYLHPPERLLEFAAKSNDEMEQRQEIMRRNTEFMERRKKI
jgi:ATP-dependent Clp protease protease subunit